MSGARAVRGLGTHRDEARGGLRGRVELLRAHLDVEEQRERPAVSFVDREHGAQARRGAGGLAELRVERPELELRRQA